VAGTPEPPPKEKTIEKWGQGGGKKLEGKLRARFRILVSGSARFLDHIAWMEWRFFSKKFQFFLG
jgi:hypothetical protein